MYVMRVFCSAAQVRMPGAFPQPLKRDSGSMNSVDLHHASKAAKRSTAAQASSGSVDAHHAADAMQVTSVALMSYNVGINNTEPRGKNWIRHKRKYYKLRDDIKSTFAHEKSIEILLLCEFGFMNSSIDVELSHGVEQPMGDTWCNVYSTYELFKKMLMDIEMTHIEVIAHPPYVALYDTTSWRVRIAEKKDKLCNTKPNLFIQHLIFQHQETDVTMRCINAHIPTSIIKAEQKGLKREFVQNLCKIATGSGTGVQQPSTVMPWLIAGDLNVDQGTMALWCQAFVVEGSDCFSKSEWPMANTGNDAQKADFIFSQGIILIPVKSWVGYHSPPCVSDAHDAVVLMGTCVDVTPKAALESAPCSSALQPTATPKKHSKVLHNIRLLEERSARVIPEIAGDGSPDTSGDSHPAATGKTLPHGDASSALQPAATEETRDVHIQSPNPSDLELKKQHFQRVLQDKSRSLTPKERAFAQKMAEGADEHEADGDASDASSAPQPAGTEVDEHGIEDVWSLIQPPLDDDPADALDVSGVAQPAHEDSVTATASGVVEYITQKAMEEDEALQEESSPDASQHTEPMLRSAAQNLLAMMFIDRGGLSIRPESELNEKLGFAIRMREIFVKRIAWHRRNQWHTEQQWLDWYNAEPLSDEDFEWAINTWREEFPMRAHTSLKIAELFHEDSRKSKKKARGLRRGAFNAYLQQECMNSNLALALLKHPSAMLDSLLKEWAQYLESPEYAEERERAKKLDDDDEQGHNEKRRQNELRMQVHILRHQVRKAAYLHGQLRRGERVWHKLRDKDKALYDSWSNGDLNKELDECTRAHGYGKLESTGEVLKAAGFPRGPMSLSA